jgi:hypothetical protein
MVDRIQEICGDLLIVGCAGNPFPSRNDGHSAEETWNQDRQQCKTGKTRMSKGSINRLSRERFCGYAPCERAGNL